MEGKNNVSNTKIKTLPSFPYKKNKNMIKIKKLGNNN